MEIAGKTFIVTGGASGLGEAAVRTLVAAGGNAVVADLNEALGSDLVKDLGERVRFCKTDVASETDAQATVNLAVSTFGGLHGLVNCAGIGGGKKILGKDGVFPLDHFVRIVNTNLVGSFNMLRLAAEAIAKGDADAAGERGVIINTASVAAFEGLVGQTAYSASKGGIVGMTLPVARELARHGIRVMAIAPGLFETPLLGRLPEDARQSLGKQVPFPSRLGRPEEYAELVKHIIENQMLNGEVIRLDGAIRMVDK